MSTIRVLAMLEATSIVGTAKAVLEFAKEATKGYAGYPRIDLTIATFDRGEGENCVTEAIRDIGTCHEVILERWRYDTQVIPQLRSLVARRGADLIWTNSVKSHFLVWWAGLHRSRKWVAFHHAYTTTDLKTQLYNQLDRWSLRTADRVLTSAAAFVGELEGRHVRPDCICVQHMPIRPFGGVSENQKARLRWQLGLEPGTRVLLSVGRLSHEKGHADLVRALPRIRELAGDAPFRLVVVGEGPERPRIEKLCRSLCLTDIVTLAGQQSEIDPYYSIADLFVLPSHSEGCPNVLLEAMAAGVPVIAAAVGGIPEIVTHGQNAILVKKRNPEDLASAAALLLHDRELCGRLVSSARGILVTKTPEAYFKSIASIFSQACAMPAGEAAGEAA